MYALDLARIATPVGVVTITGDDRYVHAIRIEPDGTLVAATTAPVRDAADQLAAWFAGTVRSFDLPLAPAATERGAALRAGMMAIGFGETCSYGALAGRIASSARAIGQACARNPFPIVVPCHRVTNADGSLGAYSAGEGATTKRWLLEHEQRHAPAGARRIGQPFDLFSR